MCLPTLLPGRTLRSDDRADVRDAYEGTIPDDDRSNTRLDALLRRASSKLAQLVPSLDRRMSAGEVDPEVPAGMVVEAVLRVWRNPLGFTQEGVGPFQGTRSKRAAMNEISYDEDDINWLLGENNVAGQFRVGPQPFQSPDGRSVDVNGIPGPTLAIWRA